MGWEVCRFRQVWRVVQGPWVDKLRRDLHRKVVWAGGPGSCIGAAGAPYRGQKFAPLRPGAALAPIASRIPAEAP